MLAVLRPKRAVCVLLAWLAVTACLACSVAEPPRSHAGKATPVQDFTEPLPFAPGHWRFVPVSELENVVLWLSHIQIRHAESDRQITGTLFDWRLDAAQPERSRREALALANEIASQLAERPETFGDLARRHSEDTTSAARAGSLGGIRASDLRGDPEVLDALAVLGPGQVSRVVETRHGFQIFLLRAAPTPASVSGQHLVIGHQAASWLTVVGAPPPPRTRVEALAMAREIRATLQAHPEAFDEMVRQRSDHPDRSVGGDLGTWSVREPTHDPRALEALGGLAEGDISQPFESHYGVEIVRRTLNRARPRYAMEAIKLAFGPGDATAKREAYELARRILGQLKQQPARFGELRKKYCCPEPESWFEGRDAPGLSRAVARLELGAIASEPVEQYATWVIPKRIDPKELPILPEATFQLPSPPRPKLEAVLQWLPAPLLAREILDLAEAYPAFTADQQRRARLPEIRSLAEQAPGSEAAGGASTSELAAAVRELFVGADAEQYRTALEDRIGNKLIASARRQ